MEFITILAWIFGALSTLYVGLTLVVGFLYRFTEKGRLQQTLDAYQGFRHTYPIIIPGVTAIICWAWIFTH